VVRLFTHRYAAVGVNGIYGCTAVFISSKVGVYLSHIWDNPVSITEDDWPPNNDASFFGNSFNALCDGTADAQSIASLITTDAQPGPPKSLCHHPPKTTDWDRNVEKITTPVRYQARAQDLASRLAGLIPGSRGSEITVG
jgi:hypothetical protein